MKSRCTSDPTSWLFNEGQDVTFKDADGSKGPVPKTSSSDECPECGGQLERDEVDIGVGVLQGPPWCPACGWAPEVKEVDDDASNKL